jgi:hypothetical protein
VTASALTILVLRIPTSSSSLKMREERTILGDDTREERTILGDDTRIVTILNNEFRELLLTVSFLMAVSVACQHCDLNTKCCLTNTKHYCWVVTRV